MRFTGKVVLLTGGGSGIGQATCLAFAREGARVAFVESVPERLAATQKLLQDGGFEHLGIVADVTSAEDRASSIEKTVRKFSGIDILVNNAGTIVPGTVLDVDEDAFALMLSVNAMSVYSYCRQVIPIMIARGGGKIVNVASRAALGGLKERAGYCASKAAVLMMTKAMAIDHARHNININAVNPGAVDTALTRFTFADPQLKKEAEQKAPFGRFMTPEEIAPAILFLASEESKMMTGSEISI
jgi:meso-butanediol dehydrogenase / (S,S)-butanediol dehydrogenase / diacetyl reductase